MKNLKLILVALLSLIIPAQFAADDAKPHNAIIFVADGLRWGSVNPRDTPALWRVRTEGVHFINSHSLFPTFTTPNASAIATGHYIGDTGVFGNGLMTRKPVPTINYSTGKTSNITMSPFDEDDWVLRCIDEQFPGNHFLDEEALLALARKNRFLTAAVGKLGPAAIQDIEQTLTVAETGKFPETIIIDDSTGWTYENKETGKKDVPVGIPLPPQIKKALEDRGMPVKSPKRVQPSVGKDTPGTLFSNDVQQHFFVDALTHVVLPVFKSDAQKRPFAVVYWSRDPDGTQHGHGDNLPSLVPGINGPTSRNAVRNADRNLQQILDYLDANGLADSTDVFVTSDHGFSTISHRDLDATGQRMTRSFSATRVYDGKSTGLLPPGFVAMDLANALKMRLFDPYEIIWGENGKPKQFREIDLAAATKEALKPDCKPRLSSMGFGWLGGTGIVTPLAKDANAPVDVDAKLIVCANGGSDLLYLPANHPMTERKALLLAVVDVLTRQDYVSGIFTDDDYGPVPGALPLSAINLKGKTTMPVPAIIVNFKTFSTDPNNPVQTEVEIADTSLLQGQGMHGSFGRGDTYNNMAAIGPSFKRGFTDFAPISNADVAQTLAYILKLPLNDVAKGDLKGRVLEEALLGRTASACVTRGVQYSQPAENGQRTFLLYQTVGGTRYFHAAGFPGRTVVGRDWEGIVNNPAERY